MSTTYDIAGKLLEIGAIQIDPAKSFVWASGIHSPIYCDNRLTLGYPEVRNAIAEAFAEKIRSEYPETEVIAGCATGGIPHAAWIADKLNLPMAYVRSSKKGHGKGNQIEGALTAGKRVLVIEDLISTGGSAITSVEALQEADAKVEAVLAIFSYGLEKATENFGGIKTDFSTLTNFDELLVTLRNADKITAAEQAELLEWRDSLA